MKYRTLFLIPSSLYIKKHFIGPIEGLLHRIIYFFIGAFAALVIVFIMNLDGNIDLAMAIKITASCFIGFSIIVTAVQFLYIRRWNQKDAAIKALYTSSEKTTKLNHIINEYLKTNYRVEHDEAIPIHEIHNKMGVFLKNGKFVYHGEQTQKDIKNIHNNPRAKNYTKKFNDQIPGREIDNLITSILNEYEYICTACMENIFNKDVVISLKGTGIIRTFNVFSNYIYHIRYDNRHKNGPRMYKNFEDFAREVSSRLSKTSENGYIPIVKSPRDVDYMTPFDDL